MKYRKQNKDSNTNNKIKQFQQENKEPNIPRIRKRGPKNYERQTRYKPEKIGYT